MPSSSSASSGRVVLPPALVERARAFRDAAAQPAPARDAASVVLLRDGPGGVEAYLLRRVAGMAFAAGMYVFPGGSVDPRDAEADPGWTGQQPEEWAQVLGCSSRLARELVCAAVRETFEESGVLLAGERSGAVVADTAAPDWEADRLALLDGVCSLGELLARRGLTLRADLLRGWAHWITPDFEARRFDTRFFVAALPVGQRTRDVGGEADRVLWLGIGDAVAGYESGELAMLPPTIAILRELAAFDTVADVLAAGGSRTVTPILPKAHWVGDELRLLLPGDEDYPQ